MPSRLEFDQRAIAVVELPGTSTECDDSEQALAERRWPVLQKEGGPSTAMTARTPRYLLECRFPGSHWAGCTPQWVCVRPIGPADGIHVDGGGPPFPPVPEDR